MAVELLPHPVNGKDGQLDGTRLINVVETAVDVSGTKTPAYWRALGVGTHGPFRMTRADAEAPGSSVTGLVYAKVKSLDTAIKVKLVYDEDDGDIVWTRVSTDETTWAPYHKPRIATQALGGSSGSETVDVLTTNPTISHTQPGIYFDETDQVDPAGLWAIKVSSDRFWIAKKTGASYTEYFTIESNGDVGINQVKEFFVGTDQVLTTRKTGWTVATGTAKRNGFATTTVTHEELAQVVKALIDDLHATAGHGLIGT